MRVACVAGARPNFMKIAPILKAGQLTVPGVGPRAHAVHSLVSELSKNGGMEGTACASARYFERSWVSRARS